MISKSAKVLARPPYCITINKQKVICFSRGQRTGSAIGATGDPAICFQLLVDILVGKLFGGGHEFPLVK